MKGPQTIRNIHKQAKTQRGLKCTKYASVNKWVKSSEEAANIKRTGVRKTKSGFKAPTYELTIRSYLAMLFDSIRLEELFAQSDEATGSELLRNVIRFVGS